MIMFFFFFSKTNSDDSVLFYDKAYGDHIIYYKYNFGSFEQSINYWFHLSKC